jgi:hypothetical protein
MVGRLDTKKRIAVVSMYDPEVEARLRPLVGGAYDLSFHLVDEAAGTAVSGEEALPALARLLPITAPLGAVAFKVPGLRDVPAVLYRAFAAGRTCAADTARASGKG